METIYINRGFMFRYVDGYAGVARFWLADFCIRRRGLEADQLIQGDRVSDCYSDKCLYKYLYNPGSLLNCIITTQKAVRFPGFPRRTSYSLHTFCQRMRASSAHAQSWLDPCRRPAGSRVGAEPVQHPARADKPCGEPGYISSGLALNLCNHAAQG